MAFTVGHIPDPNQIGLASMAKKINNLEEHIKTLEDQIKILTEQLNNILNN